MLYILRKGKIMLQSVKIHNFMCIGDFELNLSYALGKAPNGYKTNPYHCFIETGTKSKTRLVPVFAMYGANASGKTTILKAIEHLSLIVNYGFNSNLFIPNRLIEEFGEKDCSGISINFWKEDLNFKYSLCFNETGILKETLFYKDILLFDIENSTICSLSKKLEKSRKNITSYFNERCINAKNHFQIRTFLSAVVEDFPGIDPLLINAREFFLSDLVCMIAVGNDVPAIDGIKLLSATFKGTTEEKEKQAIEEILFYLKKLDIGIIGLQLQRESYSSFIDKSARTKKEKDLYSKLEQFINNTINNSNEKFVYSALTTHLTNKNNPVLLQFSDESAGTQRLVGLVGMLLASIKQGKTILVDELDDSLHILLLVEIIRMFKSKNINNQKSQLIVTLHNTELLASGLLSTSEIGIVRINKTKGSEVFRLSDNKTIRNTDNFRKLYLRGDFGGIPFPYI